MNYKRFIQGIGLEVETAVNRNYRLPTLSTILDVKGDGSIELNEESDEFIAREIVSKPLNTIGQVSRFFKEVKAMYNEKLVNDSMGFHVHLSFNKPYYYDLIYSKEFVEGFITDVFNHWQDYNPLQYRKDNSYCETAYHRGYFMSTSPSRYKAVNIVMAYRKHGTIEFRIFNSDSVSQMKKYTLFTIGRVCDYLKKYKKSVIFQTEEVSQKVRAQKIKLRGVLNV